MKKLLMLTTAAGIVVALASPTLAAQRVHRGVDAYASGELDRSGAYNYGPVNGQAAFGYVPSGGGAAYSGDQALTPHEHTFSPSYGYGQNLPYPDRPYGDPDRD